MRLYTMHIFNRQGACLYYREWERPRGPKRAEGLAEEHKLMFGFLFSLKQLVAKMSSRRGDGFHACSTCAYKLHCFEAASGLRFVLCTEPGAADLREVLRHVYAGIFVECITQNSLCRAPHDEPISCPAFVQALESYLESL